MEDKAAKKHKAPLNPEDSGFPYVHACEDGPDRDGLDRRSWRIIKEIPEI
jgi:hypothetical protein